MNCTTCRFELSQCLDGRLPSGRRATVMQHAAACGECSTFWSELQAAQQLTLQLPKQPVSDGFREQLWERIRAGEGTPDAVFHEPVPMLTKVRYALTGAAAAAALLMFATWLRDDRTRITDEDVVAKVPDGSRNGNLVGRGPTQVATHDPALEVDPLPLFTSTQPLTAGLLAVEAARGFEQRCFTTNRAIAQIGNDTGPDEVMLRRIIDDAIEARDLGAALLDLRDRDRLVFRDSEVAADLMFAVNKLGEIRPSARGFDTVRSIVEPALRSDRLGNISRAIFQQPLVDPREEQDVLIHLNTARPGVFPMLFFSFGPSDEICEEFGLFRKVGVFVLDDQCGRSYVAPRSQLDAGFQRLQVVRRGSGNTQQIEVHIQAEKK